MPVSVTDAIGPAFSRTIRICFKPFNIGKWFVIGFCAFLSTCGEGGSSYNFNSSSRSGRSRPGGPLIPPEVTNFIHDNLHWIIVLGILALFLGVAVTVGLTYLRCRGRFMFLDNIAENRGAVVDPWHRYATHAKSYFWFCILLMVISLSALVLIGGIGLLIALPDIRARQFTGPAIAAIFIGILILLPIMIALAIVQAYAYDFVVPIMMIRNTTFAPAWREARNNIRRRYLGQLVIFYLLKIVFGIASTIIGMIAVCLTLCIGALPYLSSVLLLPILVFNRVFGLTFLEQFSPDYQLMKDLPFPGAGFPVELNSPFPAPPPV